MRNLLVITTGLIACVLLCGFQQGTAPATKADNKAADGRHQNADQGQDKPAAPAPSQPVANPSSPNPNKDGNKSQDHEVRVTSLPDKIEIKAVKDSIDWTVLGCTVVLTIVGVIGTKVAVRTLGEIKRQADLMQKHADHLESLATAARDNAAAARASAEFSQRAIRNSERADVLVDSVSIVPSTSGVIDGDARLVVCFKNFGRTRASNVQFDVRMTIPDTSVNSAAPQLPIMVIGPGKDQRVSFQTFRECLTKRTFEDIIQGHTALRFVASVVYEDVFGDSYTTMDIGVFDHHSKAFRLEQNIAG
jgi:hypothetical protein